MNIAIVENEEYQTQITKERCERYCKEINQECWISSFSNGYDFLESELSIYDVIFRDIDMPGINGRNTSVKLREKGLETPLIFVTNRPQFAIDGYKAQALDFILKPMTYADFSLARRRVPSSFENQYKDGVIALNIHGSFQKFKNSEVLYFEMIRHDVHLHIKDKESIVFRSSLSKIEPLLNSQLYLKCNSGCIVNLGKATSRGSVQQGAAFCFEAKLRTETEGIKESA